MQSCPLAKDSCWAKKAGAIHAETPRDPAPPLGNATEGKAAQAGEKSSRQFEKRRVVVCHCGKEENGFGPISVSMDSAIACRSETTKAGRFYPMMRTARWPPAARNAP